MDASLKTLGAVLLQGQPVAYAAKALTDCQINYLQIEKEALGINFACEKFHSYIYNKKLIVKTDNKPLELIFNKPLYKMPLRLKRIILEVLHLSSILFI